MFSLKVAVILGTARIGRQSERVFRFVTGELAKRKNVMIEPVDVRDFRFDATALSEDQGEVGRRWQAIAKASDAFIIVTPEYNRGYPGELKMLLDAAYEEYERKPVALCTVSNGRFAGARVAEHILSVLHELGFLIVHTSTHIGGMNPAEGDKSETSIPVEASGRLSKMFDELLFLAEKLRA